MTRGELRFVTTRFGRNGTLHACDGKWLRAFLKQPGERFQG